MDNDPLKDAEPKGWTVRTLEPVGCRARFEVACDSPAGRNELRVVAKIGKIEAKAAFTILGPDEAKGYPAGNNVATCPKCHARKEACVCGTGV